MTEAVAADNQSRARDRAGTRRRRRPPKALAEAVRTSRARLGLSQRDLARAAGISQPMISMIESGQRGFGIPALRRLASALRWPDDQVERLRRKIKNGRRRRNLVRVGWRLLHESELMGRRTLAKIDRASGRRGNGGRPERRKRLARWWPNSERVQTLRGTRSSQRSPRPSVT